MMDTLYLVEQGAVVTRSSHSLVVLKGKEKRCQVPLLHLKRIIIFGNVQITTQAINSLLDEGIDVSFLNMHGKLRGRLLATESKNIFLRLGQYEHSLDSEYVLMTARAIVAAKIENSLALLQRYKRNYPDLNISETLEQLEKSWRELETKQTVQQLLGCEGITTAAYFRALGQMFRGSLSFKTRTRRPPKDPVNALMSFGYMLLFNEIHALLLAHGLDPYLGFLHGLVYGRPSLALDLLEPFRSVVVDRLVLRIFNKRQLVEGDFKAVEGKGVYLQDDALKKFIGLYEQYMRDEDKKISVRNLLKQQVRSFARSINEGCVFEPVRIKV